jgi:hypothetical protein
MERTHPDWITMEREAEKAVSQLWLAYSRKKTSYKPGTCESNSHATQGTLWLDLNLLSRADPDLKQR